MLEATARGVEEVGGDPAPAAAALERAGGELQPGPGEGALGGRVLGEGGGEHLGGYVVVASRRVDGARRARRPARAWAPPLRVRARRSAKLAGCVVDPSEPDEGVDEVGAPRLRALREPDRTQCLGQWLQRLDDGRVVVGGDRDTRAVAASSHRPADAFPSRPSPARRPGGGAAPPRRRRGAPSTEAATPWAIGLESSWPESSSSRARSTAIASASSHRPCAVPAVGERVAALAAIRPGPVW